MLLDGYDLEPASSSGRTVETLAARRCNPVSGEFGTWLVDTKREADASTPGSHHELSPYDLRHTAATTMPRAGVARPEVAQRLGHSVDLLLRVYAGVLADDRDQANALISREIIAQGAVSAPTPPSRVVCQITQIEARLARTVDKLRRPSLGGNGFHLDSEPGERVNRGRP